MIEDPTACSVAATSAAPEKGLMVDVMSSAVTGVAGGASVGSMVGVVVAGAAETGTEVGPAVAAGTPDAPHPVLTMATTPRVPIASQVRACCAMPLTSLS